MSAITRTGPRRTIEAIASAAVIVLMIQGLGIAGHQTTGLTEITGCLTQGGDFVKMALGDDPSRPCNDNQTQIHLGSGDITEVTAGFGLSGGGPEGNVGLAVDSSVIQRRVGTACTSGSSIRGINQDGSVSCETDDSGGAITGVFGNIGLTGGGFSGNLELNIASSYRLPQGCGPNQVAKRSPTGTWECGTDNDTTYNGTNFALSNQTCETGKYAKGVNSNGTLNCLFLPPEDSHGVAAHHSIGFGGVDLPDWDGDGNNPYATMATLTLPPGQYLLMGHTTFQNLYAPAGGSGNIHVFCGHTFSLSDWQSTIPGHNTTVPGPTVTGLIGLTSETTVDLRCRKHGSDGDIIPHDSAFTALKLDSINAR